jgi:RNA polymerase sigma-70 factor (ECF subfamily)
LTDVTDIELVDLAESGDAAALERLFERHYLMVYRLAYRWSGVKEDAEDIAQETFVKLVRKLHTFRRKSSFKTWLYRIAANTARDFGRRRALRKSREEAYDDRRSGHNPGVRPVDSLAGARLRETLKELSTGQREAVLLVFGEGLNHREASHVLGCREVTISWRIFQARKKLRKVREQGR